MPVLLILLAAAACLELPWPAPPGGLTAAGAAALSLLVSAVPVGLAAALSNWAVATLDRDPARRPAVLRGYVRGRRWLSFAVIGVAAAVLIGCGWGWAVWHTLTLPRGDDRLLAPGAEAVVPLPYVLMLVGCWAMYHRAEVALHRTNAVDVAARPFWSLPGYVLFHARQLALLVLFPVALFAAQQGLTRWFPQTVRSVAYQLVAVSAGVCLFVFLPRLAVPLLGLKSMPAGPTRDRLAATADRLHCRLTDILLWPTRGAVANALVFGVSPWARYVILTDRLVEHLKPDEIDAVFGHEAGHVNRGHMGYYAGFFALSAACATAVLVGAEQVAGWWDASLFPHGRPGWAAVPVLALLGGYVYLVFGLVSRRCERQADVYGARAGSCGDPRCGGHPPGFVPPPGDRHVCPAGVAALSRALAAVAALNGGDHEPAGFWGRLWGRLRAWQHGPVGDRVRFLRRLDADPDLGDRTDREVGQFRWLVLGGLAVTLVGLGTAVGWGELWARL